MCPVYTGSRGMPRRGISLPVPRYPPFFAFLPQGFSGYPEHFREVQLIILTLVFLDERLGIILDRQLMVEDPAFELLLPPHAYGQVLGRDQVSVRDQDGAFHHILEFAHVS